MLQTPLRVASFDASPLWLHNTYDDVIIEKQEMLTREAVDKPRLDNTERPMTKRNAADEMRPTQKRYKRVEREFKIIEKMVTLYCHDLHGTSDEHCKECQELLVYADRRLEKCPFQDNKPTCANCPIHCYQPKRREQIKAVMRYSGPRMMFRHPISAFRHWLDGFRKAPPRRRPHRSRSH
jgi:hypothetical protein